MISENMARPITKYATKSFDKMCNIRSRHKPTIQMVFHDFWDKFLEQPTVKKVGIRNTTKKEVEKMLSCGTLDAGYELYECPECHKSHIICYTCKSRFCSSCGVKYAQVRANNISKVSLDVSHRHVVFTMDKRLRKYFRKNYSNLKILFDSVKETLDYVFSKMVGKNKTFTPGIIMTLHTFGRDLKWNPHIHCLLTEGGMDNDSNYKPIKYINYESLRKSFMRCLLKNMKKMFVPNSKELKTFSQLVNEIYDDNKNGFYVNAPKMKQNKKGKDAVVSYIIRYTGRPVMAQSRITDYENQMISYYYEDHQTHERIDVTENVFEFISKLIIHIPETQFKMVRYYGIYATSEHKHKEAVKTMLTKVKNFIQKIKSYRRDLIDTFNVDPLLCSCGKYMEFVDYYVPEKRRSDICEKPT